MKEFFWQYFAKSGSLDAYLMYKETGEEGQEPEGMTEITGSDVLAAESEIVQ